MPDRKTLSLAATLVATVVLVRSKGLVHRAAFNAASTRRSARSLTKASTRSRVPSAKSISITPGRSSMTGRVVRRGPGMAAAVGAAGTRSPGPPSPARVNTPIGTNAGASAAEGAFGQAGSGPLAASAETAVAGGRVLRQAKTRLAFRPWRRATSATDAPGHAASLRIRCFSSGDQLRRVRLLSAPLNVPSANREPRAIAPPQAEAIMSTKPLMDISALISANNDLAEVPARVGGHPLTLIPAR